MESTTPLSPTPQLFSLNTLFSYLTRLSDTRKARGQRYRLEVILGLFILAKLCGQNKPYGIADWLHQRSTALVAMLPLPRKKLPHHSTYRRILREVVEGEELEGLVAEYLAQYAPQGQEVGLAFDGKTVRGTITLDDPFGLHLLAAYLPGEGLVLLQMVVEKDKENASVVAPKLRKSLDLRGKVVVGAALHTQRTLSVEIVQAGGHFVWIVKDNQPNTRQALAQLLAPPPPPLPGQGQPSLDFQTAKTVDKQAGRLEERTLTVSSLLNDYLDWPHLGQVFKLERRVTQLATGKSTCEVQYRLTDLPPAQASPLRLWEVVRSGGGIENGLHYRRDVTLHEDQTRFTKDSAAHIMSIINNIVLALITKTGYAFVPSARRYFAANLEEAFKLLV